MALEEKPPSTLDELEAGAAQIHTPAEVPSDYSGPVLPTAVSEAAEDPSPVQVGHDSEPRRITELKCSHCHAHFAVGETYIRHQPSNATVHRCCEHLFDATYQLNQRELAEKNENPESTPAPEPMAADAPQEEVLDLNKFEDRKKAAKKLLQMARGQIGNLFIAEKLGAGESFRITVGKIRKELKLPDYETRSPANRDAQHQLWSSFAAQGKLDFLNGKKNDQAGVGKSSKPKRTEQWTGKLDHVEDAQRRIREKAAEATKAPTEEMEETIGTTHMESLLVDPPEPDDPMHGRKVAQKVKEILEAYGFETFSYEHGKVKFAQHVVINDEL